MADPPKLPRLPKHARVQKRPLFHPAIASPHAGPSQPKVVYISTKTPFMSAVSRVRKMLAAVNKRELDSTGAGNGSGNNGDEPRVAALLSSSQSLDVEEGQGKQKEQVVLKGTNKAIAKTLSLALFFQEKEGHRIRIRTGTTSVVDDIVQRRVRKKVEADVQDGMAEAASLPETQIRKMSTVEVGILSLF